MVIYNLNSLTTRVIIIPKSEVKNVLKTIDFFNDFIYNFFII